MWESVLLYHKLLFSCFYSRLESQTKGDMERKFQQHFRWVVLSKPEADMVVQWQQFRWVVLSNPEVDMVVQWQQFRWVVLSNPEVDMVVQWQQFRWVVLRKYEVNTMKQWSNLCYSQLHIVFSVDTYGSCVNSCRARLLTQYIRQWPRCARVTRFYLDEPGSPGST